MNKEKVKNIVVGKGILVIAAVTIIFFSFLAIKQNKDREDSIDIVTSTGISLISEEEKYLLSLEYEKDVDAPFECWETLFTLSDGTVTSIPTKINDKEIGVYTKDGIKFKEVCPEGFYACESELGTPDGCCPE